jgi:sulfoxide reductase heme-binding subunit YedZ
VSRRGRLALKGLVWALCLLPLAVLIHRFWRDALGANPISEITNVLGDTTLRILLASLAVTPLRLLFGISWPVSLRRLLGLFAFFYALLHFTTWVAVDQFFDWHGMLADVRKRPYVTMGVLALTLLVPLAATSTTAMVKRLGGRNWQRLHRLVYAAGVLAILHFLWLAKKGRHEQFVYAAVLALLLGARAWEWARRAIFPRRGAPPPFRTFPRRIAPAEPALGARRQARVRVGGSAEIAPGSRPLR